MPYKATLIFCCWIFFYPLKAENFNITFLSQLEYEQSLSGIWGYTSPDNTEYALVGTELGTSIVNISNPAEPVESAFVPGENSFWREVRTHKHYAYVTNETGGGLQIIDLSALPDEVEVYNWTGPDNDLNTAHTVFIDENGYAYLNGYNNLDGSVSFANRGMMILDLNQDPTNPEIKGYFTNFYVHDAYGRNDTIYAAMIYAGEVGIIDVTDKSNPVLISSFETPSSFTHNTWLSDDGKTLFTTDEVEGAYIAAFDVSSIVNPPEIDRIRILPGTGLLPHNVHYLNSYLVASYYKTGVVIIDAKDPSNLIETGRYNTSQFEPGPGFNGAWGVYPYFPSGNIVVSDIENGLFVVKPEYQRGASLRGFVFDDKTGLTVISVNIEVENTSQRTRSNLFGEYKTGAPKSGLYNITLSRQGCQTITYTDVELVAETTVYRNFFISCTTTSVDEADADAKPYEIAYTPHGSFLVRVLSTHRQVSQIAVYDINGRKVEAHDVNNLNEIKIGEQLPSGIYLIQLSTANNQTPYTEKVLRR